MTQNADTVDDRGRADAIPLLWGDATGLRFRVDPDTAGRPVDVEFDGHRVWSFRTDAIVGEQFHPWPTALAGRMAGTGRILVRNSATGAEVAAAIVSIGGAEPRTVTDEQGRWLAVNKWGNLGVPLAGVAADGTTRLLDRTERLLADLAGLGIQAYICSGTLLGAVRSGRLLPHDDDVDLGYLAPDSDPSDLALGGLRLQRGLERLGYLVVRHSHAHLQILFLLPDGSIEHYIDIFTAFLRDGEFSQPFAMRGGVLRTDMLPLGEVELEGRRFPAPARPEAWLEACYGPGWRTPDPAFRFETPWSTIRAFGAWFGSFNRGRDFWNAEHASPNALVEARPLPALAELAAGRVVVDLGAGMTTRTKELAETGARVIVADFSVRALAVQRASGSESVSVNLNDRHSTVDFALGLLEERPIVLAVDGVLEWLDDEGVDNLLSIVRWVVREQDRAILRVRIGVDGDGTGNDHGDGSVTPGYLAEALRRNAVAAESIRRDLVDRHHAEETYLLTASPREER